MTRRVVLAAALAATAGYAVAGCGAAPDVRGMPSAAEPPDEFGRPARRLATPGPDGPSGAPARKVPERGVIVARYARARPTAWGLTVPGTVTTLGAAAVRDKAIALTFDACGGPRRDSAGCGVDAALIALLRRYDMRATLFLNSRWIAANPRVFADIAGDPRFEIANHGTRHLPLSVAGRSAYGAPGTRDVGEVYDEIAGNHENLTRLLGRSPRWFRSGTAHADDVAVKIADDLGERVVNFAINGDGGATYTRDQVQREVARAQPGDIVISHMNQPTHAVAAGYAVALPALLRRGLRTATLGEYLTSAAPADSA